MLFTKPLTILDGAHGTELQRRGVFTTLPLWSTVGLLHHPELVTAIHRDYILAGADIITLNTFRTQPRTLAKAGLQHEAERLNRLAVTLADQARRDTKVERRVLLAASMTTLEDCYRPDLAPADEVLLAEHTEQAKLLAQPEVDLLLLETFNSIRETRTAAEAATKTAKPFIVSFVIKADTSLLSGETLADAMAALTPFAPQAIMINCVPPPVASAGLQRLRELTDLPIGAYAQANGEPDHQFGWKFTSHISSQEYADVAKTWQQLGARIIGGCCGTTPEYTKTYSQLRIV